MFKMLFKFLVMGNFNQPQYPQYPETEEKRTEEKTPGELLVVF